MSINHKVKSTIHLPITYNRIQYTAIAVTGESGKIETMIPSSCQANVVGDSRIAGGNPVEISKYPFAVALLTSGGGSLTFRHGCGGTIITSRAILSAASCFYTDTEAHPASSWRARVGSTFNNESGTVYLISSITPHPEFSPTTLDNDIAVLRTSLEMRLVPGSVEVARISGSAYTFTRNQRVMAIGWGATLNDNLDSSRELLEVQVYIGDQTTCTNTWSNSGFSVTDNMVCTGGVDLETTGQCAGDEGSPLLDYSGGFVVGVFSHAEGCGLPLHDINTRLQPYVFWVIDTALA